MGRLDLSLLRTDPVLCRIGETPLVPLEGRRRSIVLGKCEFLNPTGSGKARPAAAMIAADIRNGALISGKRLLDAGSGGTAEPEALVAARFGVPLTIVAPAGTPDAKLAPIRLYGAEVILSPCAEGSEGARQFASRLARQNPTKYIFLDQYANDHNWRSQMKTGAEIMEQTAGEVTHVVGGIGTGGTLTGIARMLKPLQSVKIVGVMPRTQEHHLYGLKRVTASNKPPILDLSIIDQLIEIGDEDAWRSMHRLAQGGLMAGPSSGAVLSAWLKISTTLDKCVAVLILHDDQRKYTNLGVNTPKEKHNAGLELVNI